MVARRGDGTIGTLGCAHQPMQRIGDAALDFPAQ
jgi:hypothetical protein